MLSIKLAGISRTLWVYDKIISNFERIQMYNRTRSSKQKHVPTLSIVLKKSKVNFRSNSKINIYHFPNYNIAKRVPSSTLDIR